jgi:hypothetical protein
MASKTRGAARQLGGRFQGSACRDRIKRIKNVSSPHQERLAPAPGARVGLRTAAAASGRRRAW